MALFESKPEKTAKRTNKSDKISSATIITSCTKVTGDLNGSDTMHINGHVVGNITVSNTLVIGKNGLVEGNIEAKHAIINGELHGMAKCENLEVMQTGKVSDCIEATHLVLDGTINAEIIATELIEILEHAHVHTTSLKSKTVTVQGKVKGNITASTLLEIGLHGSVEGQTMVKNIKIDMGGKILGTLLAYQEVSSSATDNKVEETASLDTFND